MAIYDDIEYVEFACGESPSPFPQDVTFGIEKRPLFRVGLFYKRRIVTFKIWSGLQDTSIGKARALKVMVDEGLHGFLEYNEFCGELALEPDDVDSERQYSGCLTQKKRCLYLLGMSQIELADFSNELEQHIRREHVEQATRRQTDQRSGEPVQD